MVPSIVSDIIALPGWNGPMMLFLAKATLILIAALGMTVAMQRGSAGARHLVWLATLATLLLVPALAAWAPPLRVAILPPVAEQTANVISPSAEPAATPRRTPSFNPAATVENQASTSGNVPGRSSILPSLDGISLAIALWAIVALSLGAWLAYSALAVRRIVRNAQPLDTHDWLTPLYEVADRLELENPPRLLGSSEAKMPFACGFLNPAIVLPENCESWTLDRRRAVLLHELAHVKRRDLVGHTLGRLACALYWFHPLVWTAAKQLRNESERACDDLALSCGARASDYAEHLLDIVTSVRRDATPAVALAMARRKEFEGRMLAILDPELRHSMPSRRQSAALIASLALIAIVVGAAAPAPRSAEAKVRLMSSTPQLDSDFAPRDVPLAEGEDKTESGIAKPAASAAAKASGRSADRYYDKAYGETVSKSVEKSTATVTRQVIQETQRLLSSGNLTVGDLAAAARLGKNEPGSDERAELLAKVLRTDSDPSLRRTAAWGLAEYADTKVAVDALAEALRKDSDASVREMAAWALADGDGISAAVAALSTAIRNDASEDVRATAIWALGNIGDGYSIVPLVDALADKSKRIRMRAVWAIGNVEPREAPRALLAQLSDPDPGVRELTAWALYNIEDPAAVPALNAALKAESNQKLQLAYIKALAAMGEKSVDAVRGLLTSSDPRIKSMAVRALAGGHGAGPWPWPWPEPRPYP